MSYKAPLDNMRFLLSRVFNIEEALGGISEFTDFDIELYQAILEEVAKFSENILYPINRGGDEEGCHFNEGVVKTPAGYKEAYQAFCQGGWQAISGDPDFGGQGLPKTLHVLIEEIIYSANTSFCLYSSLTNGAYHAIRAHGSKALQQKYLPKMLQGDWSGAMGLTEPHAGSDLGMINTRADDNQNGSYRINGTKIFITGGEHDLSENIIHLVLAKLPNAPGGAKGISLFLVPKRKVNTDGSVGESNGISCGSIEHKMGIKASATCVMNFDNAEGYLIGEENKGLVAMFTMMNLERLSIGIQGVGLAETSYQLSKAYALDRKQGKDSSGNSVAIIRHADIRRMLLNQRSYTEACRALAVFLGLQIDKQYYHPELSERIKSEQLVALLTPVAKAFFTDKGFESCNFGVQILGGHGYIREWGLEQLVRDAKIAQIYEGTNGIQANDFLVRKVCLDKHGTLEMLFDLIEAELAAEAENNEAENLKCCLQKAMKTFQTCTLDVKDCFATRLSAVQGGATDYLHAAGHLVLGWMWLKILNALNGDLDDRFVAKRKLAGDYFSRVLDAKMNELCGKVTLGYEAIMTAQDDAI